MVTEIFARTEKALGEEYKIHPNICIMPNAGNDKEKSEKLT